MTTLLTTRTNRISAFSMLLIWMFGLMSGVANACLLEAPSAVPHTAIPHTAMQQAPLREKHISSVKHSPEVATLESLAQADDAPTSKQPCLKVCDDSSRSLPKKYPAAQIDPGLPIAAAVLWSLVEPIDLSYKQPSSTQRVASHVPLRHRLARLAL